MYKCVHCQKEKQACHCQNPFRKPDTPHDWPGQRPIMKWVFEPRKYECPDCIGVACKHTLTLRYWIGYKKPVIKATLKSYENHSIAWDRKRATRLSCPNSKGVQ